MFTHKVFGVVKIQYQTTRTLERKSYLNNVSQSKGTLKYYLKSGLCSLKPMVVKIA